tara:strand:+ start:497 stop:709 length:213 start_codon:yes stop_codon:yes gene_type:complete
MTIKKERATLNPDRIAALAEESMFGTSNPGICIACGDECDGVEPDARNYTCESCGEPEVFGAEELLMSIA